MNAAYHAFAPKPNTPLMDRVSDLFGVPITELLVDRIKKHDGSLGDIALELQVQPHIIDQWMERLNIRIIRTRRRAS